MNRIIALYGRSNCGKSTTLNILRELLRLDGQSISKNGPHSGDTPETFLYKGQIVCITPGGDNEEVILSNCEYADSKNADILITAERTKGAPIEALITYAQSNGVEIEWIRKSNEEVLSAATQELCNKETAHLLLNMVK
jgi:energy-coupling factor transporter ATP-binding protein EcfA2